MSVHNNVGLVMPTAMLAQEGATAEGAINARVTNVAAQALQALPMAVTVGENERMSFDANDLPVAVRIDFDLDEISLVKVSDADRRERNENSPTDIRTGAGLEHSTRRGAGIAASDDGAHIYRAPALTHQGLQALMRRPDRINVRVTRTFYQVIKDLFRSPEERVRVNRNRAERQAALQPVNVPLETLRIAALNQPSDEACVEFLIGKAYTGELQVTDDGEVIGVDVSRRDTEEGHAAARLLEPFLESMEFSGVHIQNTVFEQAKSDAAQVEREAAQAEREAAAQSEENTV
ncbi:hypothetical protein COB21_04810 [Candidatus Aerophobetes bacterium]|uniref:Uncharacterized protein n=1 Tax=Aerophobetes bacterium TaxID=2030807 RepID=A0A2A4X0U0_UNCAE|nr:MAG: hypothetical protein COB21_04810 [Candidatus Aerophobetes bacterium]